MTSSRRSHAVVRCLSALCGCVFAVLQTSLVLIQPSPSAAFVVQSRSEVPMGRTQQLLLPPIISTAGLDPLSASNGSPKFVHQRRYFSLAAAKASGGSSKSVPARGVTSGPSKKRKPRPVVLTHERDFFRQDARLSSMDSYVLVSTLTSSMSFGCLVGFIETTIPKSVRVYYRVLALSIQVVSGFSALFGLYATIIFSLTILYGKASLGAERDREYDRFLRRTARARVHGTRCFSLSLASFALLAVLVLVERTFLYPLCSAVVGFIASITLYYLHRDWRLLFESKELIYE